MNSQLKSPCNTPLETGTRALTVLLAVYPTAIDLQRIVELDYFILHSADVGGPESLHAPLPYRSGELLIRRSIIEAGLMLFLARGLIERIISPRGIEYIASDTASPFISSLSSNYIKKLKVRAEWASKEFADASAESMKDTANRIARLSSSQFQFSEPAKKGLA